jgi:hypothetical protein
LLGPAPPHRDQATLVIPTLDHSCGVYICSFFESPYTERVETIWIEPLLRQWKLAKMAGKQTHLTSYNVLVSSDRMERVFLGCRHRDLMKKGRHFRICRFPLNGIPLRDEQYDPWTRYILLDPRACRGSQGAQLREDKQDHLRCEWPLLCRRLHRQHSHRHSCPSARPSRELQNFCDRGLHRNDHPSRFS